MTRVEAISRRQFLAGGLAASAALAGPYRPSASGDLRAAEVQGLPGADVAEGRAGPVIDCHAHLSRRDASNADERDRQMIDAADRLGIDQLCCSILTRTKPATLEGFRDCNARMAECMKRFPGRVLGYCYVNPGYGTKAVEEIRRCVEELGFVGVKLYNAHVCTEPVVFPVIEATIELGVPILHHAGHRHHLDPRQPNISDSGDLAELGLRYPEARLICAHISGGGDWEWTVKAARRVPNVFLDTSGSVTDEGTIEMAVRTVGIDRVLFGCDNSMTAGVGKIRSAQLSPEEKQKILGGNMVQLLNRRS